jgi:hypothetical protein
MNFRRFRDLFIVARPEVGLHDYLSGHFAGRPDVEVTYDRRYGERRQRDERVPIERRRAARRRHSVAVELAAIGVAIVTVLQ